MNASDTKGKATALDIMEHGAVEERARIVVWLRSVPYDLSGPFPDASLLFKRLADDIEQGEHLK